MNDISLHARLRQAVRRPLPPTMLEALRTHFGERLSSATAVCEQHGRDESSYPVTPPDAVAFCTSNEDVQVALRLASQHRVPVIAWGIGSSLEGHVLALHGGLTLDFSRMDRILRIDAEDLTVTVEPGVTREQLNAALRDRGLFFPIDPGANATIGGMAATRASGTNAVRYGTMRENVLALEVVTADGTLMRTGSRARKSAAGYDLTRLMVGSEGTLGVIVSVTLRLHPLPESVAAAISTFPSVDAAVRCTIAIIQCGVPIARCELLDANALRAVNAYAGLSLPEAPMLLMEFHGSEAGVAEQASVVQSLADDHGGAAFDWATTPEARTRLWTARHRAYFAALQSRPGCRMITTDTCVPISRLAESVQASIDEAEAAGLPFWIVGHVGDGNFHLAYLIDPASPHEIETAERLSHRMVQRAMQLEGTCTGEHGIGLHKMGYLVEEAGEPAVAVMRAIKRALDPHDILNPGKVVQHDR